MSGESKTPFKKKSTGQKECPSREKRPGRLLEKGEVLLTVGQKHVKETQGMACRGGQGVPPGRPGAADFRAGCVPLFVWQAGGAAGCRVGGAAGCKAGSAAGRKQEVWGVPLGGGGGGCCWSQARGRGGSSGQGVLLVTGKRCGGCHWEGGVAGHRQEVWGVLLGRGCCWSQKEVWGVPLGRGCCWAGGVAGQGVLLGRECCWSQA